MALPLRFDGPSYVLAYYSRLTNARRAAAGLRRLETAGLQAKRFKGLVPAVRVLVAAREVGTDYRSFLRAQFDELPADWCTRTFRVPYPPLSLLGSEGAKWRWRRKAQWKEVTAALQPKPTSSETLVQQLANSPYELWLAAYEGRLTEEELLRCRERRLFPYELPDPVQHRQEGSSRGSSETTEG